jgi:hypothetical protein
MSHTAGYVQDFMQNLFTQAPSMALEIFNSCVLTKAIEWYKNDLWKEIL